MLEWNREKLYKIILARDQRYDGRFYCGVRTTGIYCRPICPARPKLKNIEFFRSATEAELAGFRPCLRCRPDLSPTSVQWQGTAAVVGRALRLIANGEADSLALSVFAEKFGMSDRHFRRLFTQHLGAAPIDIAISKRLHLAKQLLLQSNLPITEIAFASGFQSLRRFNSAFQQKFRSTPSHFRKLSNTKAGGELRLELPYIAPYDWDSIYTFLQNHAITGVEHFADGKYYRAFSHAQKTGWFVLQNVAAKNHLVLQLHIDDITQLRALMENVKDLFDLRLNPHLVAADLGSKNIQRIPGAWDAFETAVCIILGQLVSVEQARQKVKKLVEYFGKPIANPPSVELQKIFPQPKDLINANLRPIGLTKVREQAIKALARQVLEKKIDLSRTTDITQTRAALLELPGIGPWTVEMIALRCLGDTNAWPKTDLILKRALALQKKQDWSPWNSYRALALWKQYASSLSKKGKKQDVTL